MAQQRVGAAVTHPPLADRGVAAPRPHAQPLPEGANADTNHVGQAIEEIATPGRYRPQAYHGEENEGNGQRAPVATQPDSHSLLRRQRSAARSKWRRHTFSYDLS